MFRACQPRLPSFLVALFAALAGAGASGSDLLLPAQLAHWTRTQGQQAAAPELERLVGEQAPLFREYGSLRAEQADYRRGAAAGRITLHQMQDRSGAYGAYTLLRAGGQPVPLGEAGARTGNRLVFYQGNYLVSAEGALGVADLEGLARQLQARAPSQPSLPTLPSYLPRQGFVPGSDRYLLGPLALAHVAPLAPGDWAGFAYGAEGEAGRYRVDNAEATLLLLSYPTPQLAAERLRDFQQLFNLNGVGDPRRPLAYAKRSATLVIFVSGLESGHAASQLLDQVRYEPQVSWSRPDKLRPLPNWPDTVMNIFIGTGLLLLFALLAGLSFGLVRLLVKRWLPGKVFDRPEDSEIIVLNLEKRR